MPLSLSRRTFLHSVAAGGAGLTLAFCSPWKSAGDLPPSDAPFAPDAFLRIADDGTVTIVLGQSELGQGVHTALAMIVAEELDLNDEQDEAIAEELESYELALDEALRERNDYVGDATAKMDKAIQEGDFKKALSIVDSATRRRVAVRDVNDRYVETIAGKLPEEPAAEFRSDALRRSYPRVYRRTTAQKSFKKARALPDLTEETLAGIAAIEEMYEVEIGRAHV